MSGYYRFPTIFHDTVVFVSEDDLWSVPVSGGIARRLTSNVGEVSAPFFSPDGKWLAFVGREEGASEVYVMAAQGGPARRLTFLGSQSRVIGWTTDASSILFSSSYGQPSGHDHLLYKIAVDSQNGEATRLPYGEARSISFGPNGGVIVGRNTNDLARWKRYRGGSTGRLWIDRTGNTQFEPFLAELAGNITSPMWIVTASAQGSNANDGLGRIFFASDHEGVGNLYSCAVDGSQLRRHTDHEDFYTRHATTDGAQIVYHAGADLYVFDIASDTSQRIEIVYPSPRVQRNRKFADAARYLDSYQLHPSGKAMAITSRGKLFTFFNHEGPVLQLGQRDGVRYRQPEWFNDGRRLVVVSDELGEESLEIRTGNPNAPVRRLEKLDIGRIVTLKMSPREDKIALTNHRHELLLVDLSNLEETESKAETAQNRVTLVDRSPYRQIAGFNWSPDGYWLAYGYAATTQTTEIRLYHLTDGDASTANNQGNSSAFPNPIAITQPVLHDLRPAFDPDGRFLYFLSCREFNPVHDGLHFDIGFPWGMRPYLVLLQSDSFNPFVPRPDLEGDERESNASSGSGKNDGNGGSTPASDNDDDDDDDEDEGGESSDKAAQPAQEPQDDNNTASDGGSTQEETASAAPATPNDPNAAKPEQSKPNEAKNTKAERRLRIDLEGISQRVIAFPIPDGRYYQVMGISGKVLFSSFDIVGLLPSMPRDDDDHRNEGTLRAYSFKDYKFETLVDDINGFHLSRNGKKLIYGSGRRLRVINAGDKPPGDGGNSRRSGWIDLHRVKISVDPHSEWEQMFREAWRLQRDHFWTEDMAQVDWNSVYERYFPLIERVSSRSEFSDLMWEMQGELGTSHAYEYGGDYRSRPYYGQGFLGATCTWDAAAGGYRVSDIVAGDAWNNGTTSPLLSPGADIRNGDLLLAINGQSLSASLSPAQLLVNQADNEVLLTFALREPSPSAEAPKKGKKKGAKSAPVVKSEESPTEETAVATTLPPSTDTPTSINGRQEVRYAVIRTLTSEAGCRYRAWVEGNRRRVHEASDGKIGYLHIPNMGVYGYAEFHRGYLAEITRQGLVVDVRFNGGGNVSQLILEKLARRRIGYDFSRWGGLTPYPAESVAGPLVALTNEHAGSDGDIFCHGFKLMKLGPLIGKRTWGGVIGISPRHSLVDGTTTTQPEFSFWFEDIGWNLENQGAIPDIEVDIAPHDYAAGRDPQLDQAIHEALRLLEANPVVIPNFENRPSRAVPKLPPR
ncbi:MAG: PDZ domain-containing protein [Caldilineaceae bacterium]